MKFLWDSGEELSFDVGKMICGIHKRGKRPNAVQFSHDDMRQILSLPDEKEKREVDRWLFTVYCSLSK